jgi:hypothetical protein
MNAQIRPHLPSSPPERKTPDGITSSLILLGVTEGLSQAIHEARNIKQSLEILHAAGDIEERIVIGELIDRVNKALSEMNIDRETRLADSMERFVIDDCVVS